MDKVSVKLQGGLGNYLFQIACAFSYAKKNEKELFLTDVDSVVVHKSIETYKDNVFHKITFSKNEPHRWFSQNENGFHYNQIPKLVGNIYLNGYFQSEQYFVEYEKEIKELFSYPKEYLDNLKDKYADFLTKNLCSIHVRRGDYLKSPNHHPAQNMNYYMRAVKQMPKDSMFLIFSDDIKWCKDNFPNLPEKFCFIEGGSDHEDFLLMSLCNHNIICNSTFSWWAAWLNKNPYKKIISPIYNKWFGDAYSHYDTRDIIPKKWITL